LFKNRVRRIPIAAPLPDRHSAVDTHESDVPIDTSSEEPVLSNPGHEECLGGVTVCQKPKAKCYDNSVSSSPSFVPDLHLTISQGQSTSDLAQPVPAAISDENLALEGRGRTWGAVLCVSCDQAAFFRCRDCSLPALLCRACAISTHRLNPLHVLEVTETP
jgi:hypothetical protein